MPLHPAARPAPPPSPTSQAPTRRPSPARCSQPRATPSPLVLLLGQARDAVALAPAASRRRVDLPTPPDRPATAGPPHPAVDRPPCREEPAVGLPARPRRTAAPR